VLTHAILEALTTREADEKGNKNKRLEVAELIEHVKSTVDDLVEKINEERERNSKPKIDQACDDWTLGTNMDREWPVVTKFRRYLFNTDEILEEIKQYRDTIIDLGQRGILEKELSLDVRRVLSDWDDVVRGHVELTPELERRVEKVRSVMRRQIPEETKAYELGLIF
jgi:hypothetical protein